MLRRTPSQFRRCREILRVTLIPVVNLFWKVVRSLRSKARSSSFQCTTIPSLPIPKSTASIPPMVSRQTMKQWSLNNYTRSKRTPKRTLGSSYQPTDLTFRKTTREWSELGITQCSLTLDRLKVMIAYWRVLSRTLWSSNKRGQGRMISSSWETKPGTLEALIPLTRRTRSYERTIILLIK